MTTPAEDARALLGALVALTRQLEGSLGRCLAPLGLTFADFGVLGALASAAGGRRRVVELAGDLGWERSRLSHQVARMAERGLVTKQRCPSDRRGSFVVLEARGLTLLERARPLHDARLEELIMTRTRPAERAAVASLAERVLLGD